MNDIVIEFSTSIWKDYETTDPSLIGTFKKYHVVTGSTFTDTYMETLDSATVVLSHVKLKDRLTNIKRYDYVHIYDENNPEKLDKVMLIDNYNEDEDNINEHIFSYTINLMSETKLLEKIQCPNLTITHPTKTEGKPIIGELYSTTAYTELPDITNIPSAFNKYTVKSTNDKYYRGVKKSNSDNIGFLASTEVTSYDKTAIGEGTYFAVPPQALNGGYLAVLVTTPPSNADNNYLLLDKNRKTYNSYTEQWESAMPTLVNNGLLWCRVGTPNNIPYDDPLYYLDLYTASATLLISNKTNWGITPINDSHKVLVAKEDVGEGYLPVSSGDSRPTSLTFHIGTVPSGATLTAESNTGTVLRTITTSGDYTFSTSDMYPDPMIFRLHSNDGTFKQVSIYRPQMAYDWGSPIGTVIYPQTNTITLQATNSLNDGVLTYLSSDWKVLFYPASQNKFMYYWDGSDWHKKYDMEEDNGTDYYGKLDSTHWYLWNFNTLSWDAITITYAYADKFAYYINGGWAFDNTVTNKSYKLNGTNDYYQFNGSSWDEKANTQKWRAYKSTGNSWDSASGRDLETDDVYQTQNLDYYKWLSSHTWQNITEYEWQEIGNATFGYFLYGMIKYGYNSGSNVFYRVSDDISRKTIYELIRQYVKLFVPKIKFTSDGNGWDYQKLIKAPEPYEDTDFFDRFNVTSADLALTTPTFRQLLTTLMQQVGCIPVVKNGVLSFLDFQKKAEPFKNEDYKVNNTVNKISRSLSSDSYANVLVDMSDNVLDSGNEVICETLGFRDRENVLLKQTENLKLETKFPIYKVNEFKINFLIADDGISNYDLNRRFNPKDYFGATSEDYNFWVNLKIEIHNLGGGIDDDGYLTETGYNSAQILMETESLVSGFNIAKVRGKLHFIAFEDGVWRDVKVVDYSDGISQSASLNPIPFINDSYIKNFLTKEEALRLNIEYGTCYFVGDITFYYNNESDGFSHPVPFFINDIKRYSALITVDITPLLKENSQRQLLLTDFTDMHTASTIEQLSQYYYGTLGYSIGSNVISGFSQRFNEAQATIFGPIYYDYTYIENILTFLLKFISTGAISLPNIKNLPGIPTFTDSYKGTEVNATLTISSSPTSLITKLHLANFVTCYFDIKYQPLNSFNLSFVKKRENIDFLIEQFTNGANGLTDFDRLSVHQQETVDRIGNETLVIHQRTKNFYDIQDISNNPLYFKDDLNRDYDYGDEDEDIKYIVFKRTISINNSYYDVSYTASKDAILKNYFTSIRTKYRAYQYVDYSQSVLRKEKDLVFVLLSENGYFDGDDKIYLPNEDYEHFIDGFVFKDSSDLYSINISYACERGMNNLNLTIKTKNDVSIISNANSFALIYENYDNAGAGSYISNNSFATSADDSSKPLGGVPQSWSIWGEDYNEKHEVFYIKYLDFYYSQDDIIDKEVSGSVIRFGLNSSDVLKEAAQMPIISTEMLNETEQYAFYVVDNNKNTSTPTRTFYKDYAERINHTVQFIYYTDSKNVRWTEMFVKNNSFASRNLDIVAMRWVGITDITNLDFENGDWLKEEKRSDSVTAYSDISNVVTIDTTGDLPTINIDWDYVDYVISEDIQIIKIIAVADTGTEYYDVIAFKRPVSKIYFTLNDTKTDWAMAKAENGILYRYKQVARNTLLRKLTDEFIFTRGKLPLGVGDIKCYRASDDQEIPNNSAISQGETIYFIPTSITGYTATSIYTKSSPLNVSGDVIGANYINVETATYNLVGISENGTVTFYGYAGSQTPITTAKFKDLVFYIITANTGYDTPSQSASYVNVNESNFSFSGNTATRTFPACTPRNLSFYIHSYSGTVSGSYTHRGSTYPINISSGATGKVEVETGDSYTFTFTPNDGYYFDGQTTYTDTNITKTLNGGQIYFSAASYKNIQVDINSHIQSISLTVKRGSTTIFSQNLTSSTNVPNLKNGDVYSWRATPEEGYTIVGTSYESDKEITSNVTISPITTPVYIPGGYDVYSPVRNQTVDSPSEDSWNKYLSIRNLYLNFDSYDDQPGAYLYINGYRKFVGQNLIGQTSFELSSLNITRNNAEFATEPHGGSPSVVDIEGTLNLNNYNYFELYVDGYSELKYRVYLFKLHVREYNAGQLYTGTNYRFTAHIGLPSGYELVENNFPIRFNKSFIDDGSSIVLGENNEIFSMFSIRTGLTSREDNMYLTVVIKNW